MKYSLLYKIDEAECGTDNGLIDNLLLTDAFKDIHPNPKAIRYFLNVLKNPPKMAENAKHRAEILADFHAHPTMPAKLLTLFKVLDDIPQNFQSERTLLRTSATFGSEARYQTATKQIFLAALTLAEVFEKLNELKTYLELCELTASGLIALLQRLQALFSNPQYGVLREILERLTTLPEDYLIELQFTLGALGRLKEYDILSIGTMPLVETRPKGILRFFQSAAEREFAESNKRYRDVSGVPVPTESTALRNQSVGGVYEKLTEMLNLILGALFGEFCGMSPELQFYQVALNLIEFYEKKEIDFCYATYTDQGVIDIRALKDPVLIAEGHGETTVVPNDVYFSDTSPGILITGENSSGKTVYLRSIAIALLFAQNGLPVTAKSATISHFHTIYTLFATGEKAASIGTGAGRFEEEVSALSEIIDSLGEGDLIFLNEIFQTTSYSEGAVGLYHILKHLAARGVRWACVSHLTDLFTLFKKDEVRMLITSDPGGETPYRLMDKE